MGDNEYWVDWGDGELQLLALTPEAHWTTSPTPTFEVEKRLEPVPADVITVENWQTTLGSPQSGKAWVPQEGRGRYRQQRYTSISDRQRRQMMQAMDAKDCQQQGWTLEAAAEYQKQQAVGKWTPAGGFYLTPDAPTGFMWQASLEEHCLDIYLLPLEAGRIFCGFEGDLPAPPANRQWIPYGPQGRYVLAAVVDPRHWQ